MAEEGCATSCLRLRGSLAEAPNSHQADVEGEGGPQGATGPLAHQAGWRKSPPCHQGSGQAPRPSWGCGLGGNHLLLCSCSPQLPTQTPPVARHHGSARAEPTRAPPRPPGRQARPAGTPQPSPDATQRPGRCPWPSALAAGTGATPDPGTQWPPAVHQLLCQAGWPRASPLISRWSWAWHSCSWPLLLALLAPPSVHTGPRPPRHVPQPSSPSCSTPGPLLS